VGYNSVAIFIRLAVVASLAVSHVFEILTLKNFKRQYLENVRYGKGGNNC